MPPMQSWRRVALGAREFMDDKHWPAEVRTRHGVDCTIDRSKNGRTLLAFRLASPAQIFNDAHVAATVVDLTEMDIFASAQT